MSRVLKYATTNSYGVHDTQNTDSVGTCLFLERLGYDPTPNKQWYYLKNDGEKVYINEKKSFSGKTFVEAIKEPDLINSENAIITLYVNWKLWDSGFV